MNKIKKVSVIGIGGVGANAACFSTFISDNLVLYNRQRSDEDERVDGTIRDMCDALSHFTGCNIKGSNSIEDIADSDVVVTTIGLGREFGFETRDMLFFKNASLIKATMNNIKKISPDARVIIATNPVDYMGTIARAAGFPEENIFCLGGELDTARLGRFICDALERKIGRYVNPRELEDIYVVGSHGPNMIPVFSHGKFEGKYLKKILDDEDIKAITQQTKSEGATITKKKGKSGAIGPGASIARMIDKGHNGLPMIAHTYVTPAELKELGIEIDSDNSVFTGMPFRFRSRGRQLISISMTDEERSALIKFIKGQNARDDEVRVILSKTEEGLSKEEKVDNFISFMAQKGVIIKPVLGEEGGYEIYKEDEDPRNALSINIWKYI